MSAPVVGFAIGFLLMQVSGKPTSAWVGLLGIAAMAMMLAHLAAHLTEDTP